MFLVTGASGNVGTELVAGLVEAGLPTRALVRTPREITGVETVTGDLDDPATLGPALDGVQAMFLLPGYGGLAEMLAMAARAGVAKVVLLSGGSAAGGDRQNAVARYMIESEDAVRASGLAWTVVRSGAFMSNALRWLPQLRTGDEVRVPFGTVRTAPIDPYDIAAVVRTAMVGRDHDGLVHRVSGPESLLPAEQVAILGAAIGRDLRCVELTDEEARAELEASMPVEYVDAFFSFYVDGTLDESQVLPTVEQVTGRAPRTFATWARTHAAAFA